MREIVNPNLWTVVRWGIIKRVILFNKYYLAALSLVALASFYLGGVLAALGVVLVLPPLTYLAIYWVVSQQQLKVVSSGLNSIFRNYVEPERSNFWVAEFSGKIIGCVALEETSDMIGTLRSMSIDQSYHGLGVGKRLMEVLLAFCKEHSYQEIRLETTEFQIAAQRLYEKYSFQRVDGLQVPLLFGTSMEIRAYVLKLS